MKSILLTGFVTLLACLALNVYAVEEEPTYECQGSFSWDTQRVWVDMDFIIGGWHAMSMDLEFDDEAGCNVSGDGVECTKNNKNIKTSSIDDYFTASSNFAAPLSPQWELIDVAGARYATLHAEVYQPGSCAEVLEPGVGECDGNGETTDDICYLSASGGYFETAEESCEDSFNFNGEGAYAGGIPFSENRHPKKGNNKGAVKSWTMYVDLTDPQCTGTTDETDTGGVCDYVHDVDLIADGGGYGEDGAVEGTDYLNVGLVEFYPEDSCEVVCTNCPPRTIFLTSTKHNGSLGGLDGADAVCQAAADNASLNGTFKAWLADDTGSPSSRHTRYAVDYQLPGGTTVASSWLDLANNELQNPIDEDELGNIIDPDPTTDSENDPFGNVAKGGNLDPTALINVTTPAHCSNWTTSTSSHDNASWIGDITTVSPDWMSRRFFRCHVPKRLICVEQ